MKENFQDISALLAAGSGAMTAPGSGAQIGEGIKGAAATGSDAGWNIATGEVHWQELQVRPQVFRETSAARNGSGMDEEWYRNVRYRFKIFNKSRRNFKHRPI